MSPRKREFIRLFNASGWKAAEAARQLGFTRGGMHGLLKGDTVPSATTIRLFKLILASEKPEALKTEIRFQEDETLAEETAAEGLDVDGLTRDLAALPAERQREVVDAIRALIQALTRKNGE